MQLIFEAGLLFGIIMFMTTFDWSDALHGPSKTFMRGLAFAGVMAIIVLSIRVLIMLVAILIAIFLVSSIWSIIIVPIVLFGLYKLIIALINIIRDMQCKPPIGKRNKKKWLQKKKKRKNSDEDDDYDDEDYDDEDDE